MSISEDEELLRVAALLESAEGVEPTRRAESATSVPTSSEQTAAEPYEEDLAAIAAYLQHDDDDDFVPEPTPPTLPEDATFAAAINGGQSAPALKGAPKPAEDFDSSDEEERSNFLEQKYNEYGRNINKRLKERRQQAHEAKIASEVFALSKDHSDATSSKLIFSTKDETVHIKNPHRELKRVSLLSRTFQQPVQAIPVATPPPAEKPMPIYLDPIFGLRIIKPLVSSELLKERMQGRQPVLFSNVARHIEHGDLSKDWVIGGVLVTKFPLRTTKKGDTYSMWQLSDLRGDIKTLTLFLFRTAHKELWKTPEGTCIAVLNPSIFERRAGSNDVACLTIDSANKVMILGTSKDLGRCRANKRNGDKCTSLVNLSECDYCVYHVKQEFGKMSRRSELQSATSGRGLNELRNKVLGKSEVFYAGQSFTAVPARKPTKLIAKDKERLMSLSEYAVSPFASSANHAAKSRNPAVPYAERSGAISRLSENVDTNSKQRQKDLERLKLLLGPAESASSAPTTSSPPIASAASTNASVLDKFKHAGFNLPVLPAKPRLSSENFCIEVPVGPVSAVAARQRAAQILKQRPLAKSDPNGTRGTRSGKRRAIDLMHEEFQADSAKRQKQQEDERELARKSRIERIMAAASSHTNLIDQREAQQRDDYFDKLEKKEAMEEKMLATFKIACKAVSCKICKYTAFSASESCKQQRHPLKVIDAEKRFFQCKDCGNRTVTLHRLPDENCRNCQGASWQRAAMIRERKVPTAGDALSIRGHEETFIGSCSTVGASLNLLVPEE